MDNNNPLKIKLKLGNRSNSPSVSSHLEGESDEELHDAQNVQNQQDSPISEPPPESMEVVDEDGSRERHKKPKKKKKKKEKDRSKHKHKHNKEKLEGIDEPPAKRMRIDSGETEAHAFKEFLGHLLEALRKKDVQQFFNIPVTDDIAPGYSAIIKEPMDFSLMKQKVEENQYLNLEAFKNDFYLICNNCSKYNHEDTIYHKAAKKLLHSGQKVFTPERLIQLGNGIPNFLQIGSEKMGFEISSMASIGDLDGSTTTPRFADTDANSDSASCSGDLPPSVILQEAQAAAKEAAERLTQKKPSSTLGFLRQKNDGTTSLNFLTGCEGSAWPNKEKTVSLGVLTGKPTQGTASLTNCREDKRSMAKPVRPVFYGAFSSFCPSYDSTFANLSREESEMLHSTYGNEDAVQYAKCISDFSRDCDMAMHLVDQLLNLLTHDQHSRTKNILDERKRTQQPAPPVKTELPELKPVSTPYGFDNLRKLSEHGIDMSFLKTFEEMEHQETSIENKLRNTASLLNSLSKEQHNRLSSPLPSNLNNLPPPGPAEVKLAEKVSESLVSVAKEVPPGSIAPVPTVRRAMGITLSPVKAESQVQVDVVTPVEP